MGHSHMVDTKDGDIKFSRFAGILEQYHIVRHSLGLDTCLLLAVKYTNPNGSHLNRSVVFRALNAAVQHHAALWLKINNERSQHPFFSFLDKLDLNQIVSFTEENTGDIQDVAHKEFLKPFNTSENVPLWRLRVLSDDMIIYAWHHGLGDGLSGLAFLHSFHESLLKLDSTPSEKEESVDIIKLPTTLKQMQPIEKITDLSVPFTTVVKELFGLIFPMKWRRRNEWTGNAVPHSFELINNAKFITLPLETVGRILTLARSHKATLTSTFYVVAICALSSLVISSNSKVQYKTIPGTIPVSLRKLSSLPLSTFGDLVSTVYFNLPVLKTGFSWSLATEIAETLRNSVPGSRKTIGSLKLLLGRYEPFLTGKLGSKRDVGLELSNIGLFEYSTKSGSEPVATDSWNIGEMYFSQNDAVLGAAFKLNVVGSPNGSVSISVTWGKGAIDDEFAEAFIKRFTSGIDELAVTK